MEFQTLFDAGRRLLRRRKWSALAAVGLGVAIGFAGVAGSVARQLLVAPLPIPYGRSVFVVHSQWPAGLFSAFTYPQWLLVSGSEALLPSAASGTEVLPVRSDGPAVELRVAFVTGRYFEAIGIVPLAGRSITPRDDAPAAEPAVILAHHAWLRLFRGRSDAVGSRLRVNGVHVNVIGVAPPRFQGLDLSSPVDLFAPLQSHPLLANQRPGYLEMTGDGDWLSWLSIVGVVSQETASTEQTSQHVNRLAQSKGWAEGSGRSDPKQPRLTLVPAQVAAVPVVGRQDVVRFVRNLSILSAVLLWSGIAAAMNIAVAGNSLRRREVWIRFALGMRRRHVLAAAFVEHGLFVGLATLSGIVAGAYAIGVLSRLRLPAELRQIDLQNLVSAARSHFVTAVAALALLALAALVWAAVRRAAKGDYDIAIAGRTAAPSRAVGRTTAVLAGAQAALATIAISGTLSLSDAARAITTVDPGFSVDGRLAISFGSARFSELPDPQRALDMIRSVPGVLDAEIASRRFGSGGQSARSVSVDGKPVATPPLVEIAYVGPRFFQVIGSHILRGRAFEWRDGRSAGLINETAAARLFPGADPLGRRVSLSLNAGIEIEIIGIVRDMKLIDIREPKRCAVYLPVPSQDIRRMARHVLVRTQSSDVPRVGEATRAAIAAIAPEVPVSVRSIRDLVDSNADRERVLASLMAIIAIATTTLAILSIAALVRVETTARRHEMSVRVALGATHWRLLIVFGRRAARILAVGTAVGLLGSRALIDQLVPGTSSVDSLVTACAAVALAVAIPSILELARAIGANPIGDLRSD